MTELSRKPTPDMAENNAFFPSPYSLSLYTSPKTDFAGYGDITPYSGKRNKILMVGSDERYVMTRTGRYFSTGNHPVETLLPLMHIAHAGFTIEVATLSGNMVKLEQWAMPREDKPVMDYYDSILPKFQNPHALRDIIDEVTAPDSPYAGVFFPGGHGALLNLPTDENVKKLLSWAVKNDRKIITLCHGPAALLAASVGEDKENYLFKDYEIMCFPDALDEGANQDIGYMPGRLTWLLADSLEKAGIHILNKDMSGAVHEDRQLLTGDSPLAANALGLLSARVLTSMKD